MSLTFEAVALATLILVLTIGVYKLVRFGIAASIKRLLRHEYPGKAFVTQNKAIYTAIIEMRALTEADRAYVIQFHNGQEFLLSNPVWKMTCTHEVVRPGVTYEASTIQNILASRVSEIIESVISGDFTGQGVSRGPLCAKCSMSDKCIAEQKHLSVIQVSELPVGFSRYFLENQNIRTVVQCGTSNKHGAFGLVGIDFCGQPVTDVERLKQVSEHVCVTAEKVKYFLQHKEVPVSPSRHGE